MSERRTRAARKRARRRKVVMRRVAYAVMGAAAVAMVVLIVVLTSGGGSNDTVTVDAGLTSPPPSTPAASAVATLEPAETEVAPPTPDTGPSTPDPTPEPTSPPPSEPVTITISAAGDCTLGGDMLGPSEKAFYEEVSKSGVVDYDYCFKNVRDIFADDDLTIVNFEVVLTESKNYMKRSDKTYIMRGRPEYAKMLTSGDIEAVNIANNHIDDFSDDGIDETISHLDAEGILSFGREKIEYFEVEGVTIGLVGFSIWTTETDVIEAVMAEARANSDILIVSFHWGSELKYEANSKQQTYGRRMVDLGADLVLGHHPHVVNGIEVYKGVSIVYSLGNFCFGGKRNPTDKDTFIYQHTFTFENGAITAHQPKIIPCRITSASDHNNYQPTPVTGDRAEDIYKKIWNHSKSFDQPLDVASAK